VNFNEGVQRSQVLISSRRDNWKYCADRNRHFPSNGQAQDPIYGRAIQVFEIKQPGA